MFRIQLQAKWHIQSENAASKLMCVLSGCEVNRRTHAHKLKAFSYLRGGRKVQLPSVNEQTSPAVFTKSSLTEDKRWNCSQPRRSDFRAFLLGDAQYQQRDTRAAAAAGAREEEQCSHSLCLNNVPPFMYRFRCWIIGGISLCWSFFSVSGEMSVFAPGWHVVAM